MYKSRYTIGILVALLTFINVSAQNVTSNNVGYIQKVSEVNFAEIATYYQAHPTPHVRRLPFDEGDENEARPTHPIADPGLVRLYNPSHGSETPHTAYLPVSTSPTDTFLCQTTDGDDIPPDVHGAVSPTYVVCTLNDSVVVQSRTGTTVYKVQIDNFWHTLEGSGTGAYDPRILYDPNYQRWIMVADCYGELATSQIMIAVSQTNDPTGTWNMYKLAVGSGTGSGKWLDFPCVGFNNRWIAVSGNFFEITGTGGFISDVVYVFNYASMMSGAAMGTYQTINPTGGSFTICPASTYDAGEPNMFFIENWNGGGGQLRLSKLTGTTLGSLTFATVTMPTTSIHWNSSPNLPASATSSDFVPQSGTTNKLQANDDRINNFQQRNNTLWCAHTIFLPAGSATSTRASSMWWQVDTNGTVAQVDTIDDKTGVDNFWFPSISANDSGDALIGFAHSSTLMHPSCAYSIHMHTDAASSHRPVFTYKHGQNTYYQTFGDGENRWGDYTATVTDPADGLDFWTLQESVPTTANKWNTWWAYVQVCITLSAPTGVIAPGSQCAGTSAWYSANTVAGATGYTWTVSGTGWTYTTSAGTDSIYLTASSTAGIATITVASDNSCGPGTQYVFTVNPLPIPNETISTPDSICAGATSAVFNAAATGSPTSYSWTVLGTGWSGSSTTSSMTATIGSGTGTIIVNATNSCGTGPNDTLSVTPGNPPGPATAINSSATVYCIGSTDTLTTPAVSGATSYTWTIAGTGWSGTSTTNSIYALIGSGTATITVTPVNACGDGTPFTISGIVPVTPPVPTFSESTHVTTTHTNVTVTYEGAITSGMTFTWNFDGGTAVPTTGPGPINVKWATPGTYTVTLTVDNGGCVGTYSDTVHVNPTLAVQQVNITSFNANIVPNPNSGSFDVIFDEPVTKPVMLKISDIEGRTIYTNDYGIINSDKLPVVTDNLAPGTYNATIFVDGIFVTKKITIIR